MKKKFAAILAVVALAVIGGVIYAGSAQGTGNHTCGGPYQDECPPETTPPTPTDVPSDVPSETPSETPSTPPSETPKPTPPAETEPPSPTPPPKPTPPPPAPKQPKDCGDYATQGEAQNAMYNGVKGLDKDNDGLACAHKASLPPNEPMAPNQALPDTGGPTDLALIGGGLLIALSTVLLLWRRKFVLAETRA